MSGFLLQWPAMLTVLMFPVSVTMYVLLAHREERDALAEYGEQYQRYMAGTPGFFPRARNLTDRDFCRRGVNSA